MNSNSKRCKALRDKYKLNGECISGDKNPVVPGRVLCENCFLKRKEIRRKRKEKGECSAGCGTIITKETKCEDCKIKHLTTKFGLTIEEYALLNKDKCCMICKATWPLVIDHDHATNKIRGILCKQCNIALGGAKDNIETLTLLIEYLKEPPAKIILGKDCFRKHKTTKILPGIIKDGRGYKRKKCQ